MNDLYTIERSLHDRGLQKIAGVDEAGRGPLAGPVVAAAVVFAPDTRIDGVNDSKKLAPAVRERLYDEILRAAVATGIGIEDNEVIDRLNILNATFAAMHTALGNLGFTPDHVLVDGNMFRTATYEYTAVVSGDALCFSIAAASILAKVTRDRLMAEYAVQYPGYGFERHKGYGTRAHFAALGRLGPCRIHRLSFLTRVPAPSPAETHAPVLKGENYGSADTEIASQPGGGEDG